MERTKRIVENLPGVTVESRLGVTRKITDHEQAEEALQGERSFLRKVIDAVPSLIFVKDWEGCFVLANKALAHAYGTSVDEMTGKTDADFNADPEQVARFRHDDREVVSSRKEKLFQDEKVTFADGQLHWFTTVKVPVIGEDGACDKVLGVATDISERKRLEQALEERAEQLAESARRKDEFLAMLAHELRNPLAPLRNGIDVLRILPPNGEQSKQILDMMEEQAHNLARLIDDLLDVSRCGRGKLELRRKRVALSKVITSAIQTVQSLVAANGHELAVVQARESLCLCGDPTRLTQVVSNLLNNATRYTPRGGKILLTTERIGDEVAIRVKDNGMGIASDMLPRIFEMFVQADSSLNRRHGGLGIGLTLVKSLVEMHGGAVEAASDGLGKGSEFTVRFPLLPSSDVLREEATDIPDQAKSFPPHRILIVDDVRPAALIVATLFRSWRQNVRTATSGAEALAMIEQEKPELILSDISMPEMTGYELAQEIRRRPEWNDIFLVAVSGYGQESDRLRAKEAGFDSHVVKPISKGDLERLLVSLTRGS